MGRAGGAPRELSIRFNRSIEEPVGPAAAEGLEEEGEGRTGAADCGLEGIEGGAPREGREGGGPVGLREGGREEGTAGAGAAAAALVRALIMAIKSRPPSLAPAFFLSSFLAPRAVADLVPRM